MPGAYVVTLDSEPVLYVERGGRGLLHARASRATGCREALEALADHVRRGRLKRLALERFDGEPVVGSEYERTAGRGRLPPEPEEAHPQRMTAC